MELEQFSWVLRQPYPHAVWLTCQVHHGTKYHCLVTSAFSHVMKHPWIAQRLCVSVFNNRIIVQFLKCINFPPIMGELVGEATDQQRRGPRSPRPLACWWWRNCHQKVEDAVIRGKAWNEKQAELLVTALSVKSSSGVVTGQGEPWVRWGGCPKYREERRSHQPTDLEIWATSSLIFLCFHVGTGRVLQPDSQFG